jgi:release factor glutamine methyltransferase
LTGAHVTATDRSADALALARENAVQTGLEVTFVEADLLAGIEGPFDLVVSNPPYVEPAEIDGLAPEVREWEPRGALIDEGQTARLAREATRVLDGWIVLEVHEAHAVDVRELLSELGYAGASIGADLAGKQRFVEAQWLSRPTPEM